MSSGKRKSLSYFSMNRASGACEACHLRKVRCDAASLGTPCTNCAAFSLDCRIRQLRPRRSRNKSAHMQRDHMDRTAYCDLWKSDDLDPGAERQRLVGWKVLLPHNDMSVDNIFRMKLGDQSCPQTIQFGITPHSGIGTTDTLYLGDSSALPADLRRYCTTDSRIDHSGSKKVRTDSRCRDGLHKGDVEILRKRGAFLLPPRQQCDQLVGAYLQWVAPVRPVISTTKFLRQYQDIKTQPPLLLMQAVLLAGSIVLNSPNRASNCSSEVFYKRVKALYDAGYDKDPITILQSVILIKYYAESGRNATVSAAYWHQIGIAIAQNCGLHKSAFTSQTHEREKKLWRRIWWTLIAQDRLIGAWCANFTLLDPHSFEVEMVEEADFKEDDFEHQAGITVDRLHAQFFIQSLHLSGILAKAVSQQEAVGPRAPDKKRGESNSDVDLRDWARACPSELQWHRTRHNYWSALLCLQYHVIRYRQTELRAQSTVNFVAPSSSHGWEEPVNPTDIYASALIITSIVQCMQGKGETRCAPPVLEQALYVALTIYRTRFPCSKWTNIRETNEKRIRFCMDALADIRSDWQCRKNEHSIRQQVFRDMELQEESQITMNKYPQGQQVLVEVPETLELLDHATLHKDDRSKVHDTTIQPLGVTKLPSPLGIQDPFLFLTDSSLIPLQVDQNVQDQPIQETENYTQGCFSPIDTAVALHSVSKNAISKSTESIREPDIKPCGISHDQQVSSRLKMHFRKQYDSSLEHREDHKPREMGSGLILLQEAAEQAKSHVDKPLHALKTPLFPNSLDADEWYAFVSSNATGSPHDLLNLYQKAAFPA